MPVVPGKIQYRFDIRFTTTFKTAESYIALVDVNDQQVAIAQLKAVRDVVSIQEVSYKGLATAVDYPRDAPATPQGEP